MATDDQTNPNSFDASADDNRRSYNKNRTDAKSKQSAFGIERPMPHALDAEKSILSSMLQTPEEYVIIAMEKALSLDHFYKPAHKALYRIFTELSEKNEPIELISLTSKLDDRELLEKIGGRNYLEEIFTFAATAAHFHYHLELVKDKFTLRNIITKCTEAVTRSYEDQEEVPQLLDSIEQNIFSIRESAGAVEENSISRLTEAVYEDFKKMMNGEPSGSGIKTGYSKLDKMSDGLKAGEMFIIAARPSMGKTSFAMNIIEHVCLDQKLPAMVFSLEMPAQQLVQRLLYARARYPLANIKSGMKPKAEQLENMLRAMREIKDSKLCIDDTAGISISELRAKARRKKKEEDIQCIAIDYLQLMRSTSKQAQNSREREIAEISAGLKALAKELSIPVIVLAQLNRGPENRGGTPKMSDLRESGSIEQDADMIGLLFRSKYYAETEEERNELEGIAELTLAKNRNGATGSIPLTFIENLMRFETRADSPEPV